MRAPVAPIGMPERAGTAVHIDARMCPIPTSRIAAIVTTAKASLIS